MLKNLCLGHSREREDLTVPTTTGQLCPEPPGLSFPWREAGSSFRDTSRAMGTSCPEATVEVDFGAPPSVGQQRGHGASWERRGVLLSLRGQKVFWLQGGRPAASSPGWVENTVLLSTPSSLGQRLCPRSRSREPVGSGGPSTPHLSSIVLHRSPNRTGGNECCPIISPLTGLLILPPRRTKAAP